MARIERGPQLPHGELWKALDTAADPKTKLASKELQEAGELLLETIGKGSALILQPEDARVITINW